MFETDAGGDRAGQICQGLGFDNSFGWMLWDKVEAYGYSGDQVWVR